MRLHLIYAETNKMQKMSFRIHLFSITHMKKEFDTEEHIRAWLIRVAINKAKNITRSFWHRNKCNLEEYMETLTFETPESETLFDTVMKLPEKVPDCPASLLL